MNLVDTKKVTEYLNTVIGDVTIKHMESIEKATEQRYKDGYFAGMLFALETVRYRILANDLTLETIE